METSECGDGVKPKRQVFRSGKTKHKALFIKTEGDPMRGQTWGWRRPGRSCEAEMSMVGGGDLRGFGRGWGEVEAPL